MNWLLPLYPARWRVRYGEEFWRRAGKSARLCGPGFGRLSRSRRRAPVSTDSEFSIEAD